MRDAGPEAITDELTGPIVGSTVTGQIVNVQGWVRPANSSAFQVLAMDNGEPVQLKRGICIPRIIC